jgi:protein tyrosine/serine phosphatase
MTTVETGRPAEPGLPSAPQGRARRRSLRQRLRPIAAWFVGGLQRHRGAMDTPWRAALGHIEHVFVDHAFFRFVYLNRHAIAPGVERAAQPSPRHVRAAARRGVRTIVNLRGPGPGASYLMEQAACAEHGIRLVDFVLNSRALPSRERVLAFGELMAELERPVLLHCKSGADRVGLASALYLLLREGRPVEEALGHLALRYGHFSSAKTGVLDALFRAYKRANDARPIDFRTWIAEDYDPQAVTAAFRSRRLADLFTDRLLGRE